MVYHEQDGGPAFPMPDVAPAQEGMSLRDYFAGQVLAGVMGPFFQEFKDQSPAYTVSGDFLVAISEWAYEIADYMLDRRRCSD